MYCCFMRSVYEREESDILLDGTVRSAKNGEQVQVTRLLYDTSCQAFQKKPDVSVQPVLGCSSSLIRPQDHSMTSSTTHTFFHGFKYHLQLQLESQQPPNPRHDNTHNQTPPPNTSHKAIDAQNDTRIA